MGIVLHPIEVEILKAIRGKGYVKLDDLNTVTGLSVDQVRRGIEWLKDKKLINVREKVDVIVELDTLGIKALEEGFPERRIYNFLENVKNVTLEDVRKKSEMDEKEFSAALGVAVKKRLVKLIKKGNSVFLEANPPTVLHTELLIRRISAQKEINISQLNDEEMEALEELKKRPDYVRLKEVKQLAVEASPSSSTVLEEYLKKSYVDKLTPELLSTGKWEKVSFRPYNVESPVPTLYPGRMHPVQDFIGRVREIFLNFGFEEIEGPVLLPSFWNFDALFIPQDHPARDMQDTFYLKDIRAMELEKNAPVDIVSKVHEDGGGTGSIGWRYKWSIEEAEKMVLRPHTTPITVRYLYERKPSSAKVFSIDKVFRNENLDSRHLFEFYQYEGIVTGKNVTMRNLIGVLTDFYKELGFNKVKFWPTFFPYTEPSLEAVAYVEKLGRWIELCGMGVFRPEVTLPAGVKNPVLAWGGGLERLILLAYDIEDIRLLYRNNLSWLRGVSYARTDY
jgi:phenylalanyl-tRNA synthetase alpha chain